MKFSAYTDNRNLYNSSRDIKRSLIPYINFKEPICLDIKSIYTHHNLDNTSTKNIDAYELHNMLIKNICNMHPFYDNSATLIYGISFESLNDIKQKIGCEKASLSFTVKKWWPYE